MKIQFYIFSRFFRRKFDWQKNSRCVRKAFYVSNGTFRRKSFGWNQNVSTFGQWARRSRFLGETVLAELSTSHCMYPEQDFGQKLFVRKEHIFHSLFCFSVMNFRTFGKSFQQRCQNRKLSDQKNFLRKFPSDEDLILYFFLVFPKKVWLAKKLHDHQEEILRVQWNIPREKVPEEIKLYYFCCSERQNYFWDFWWNKFDRVATTALQVTRGASGVKWTFFSKKIPVWIFFPFFSEKVPDSWQLYPPGVSNP